MASTAVLQRVLLSGQWLLQPLQGQGLLQLRYRQEQPLLETSPVCREAMVPTAVPRTAAASLWLLLPAASLLLSFALQYHMDAIVSLQTGEASKTCSYGMHCSAKTAYSSSP